MASIDGISGDGRVFSRTAKGNKRGQEILFIKSGNAIYSALDERIPGYDDDSYGHDFELSPDAKWLLVSRKLFHTTNTAYLYHFDGKRFVKVRPQGLRFDDAALTFFSHRLHFPYTAIGTGPRIFGLDHWTADGKRLAFEFDSSKHYGSKRYFTLHGYYDLAARRFNLVSFAVEND